MKRNIKVLYALGFLNNFWIWLGVWVFYYLRFTDYAGIGIVESVMITSLTLAEIPTGAIADLVGKSKTLTMSFLFMAFCNFLLSSANVFSTLVISVFFGGVGLALGSGSFEALIYDSLKEIGKEDKFDKTISNITTIKLISTAVAGSLSGLLYVLNPRYPFAAAGVTYFVGFLLTLLLKEPKIDTEKFSLKVFVEQNKQGFIKLKELFNKEKLAILIVIVGSLWVISDEMLENILEVEFGYTAKYIGIFTALVFVISAFASQLTPIIGRKIGNKKGLVGASLLMSICYLLSPFAGIFLGSVTIAIRDASSRIFQNFTTIIFNKNIDSKYRATVLSSYNMFKNLPYVLSAYLLGSLMDAITAKNFAFIMGIIIFIVAAWKIFPLVRSNRSLNREII